MTNSFQNNGQILLIGASTDERILRAANELHNQAPETSILLLRPRREEIIDTGPFDQIIDCPASTILPADILRCPSAPTCVFVYGHTGRPGYRKLGQSCLQQSTHCFLFNDNGLQPFDLRDIQQQWPSAIQTETPKCKQTQDIQSHAFFRPSDRTAHALAEQYRQNGCTAFKVDTLAALEKMLPRVDSVFFDWCLTDYGILFPALQLVKDAGKRAECFLALDLADVAEDKETGQRLIELNRTALHAMDHIWILGSRMHLAERYQLGASRLQTVWNIPDETVWHSHPRNKQADHDAPIRFVYHGLLYFWHELAEFIPVYNAVKRHHPVQLELFGRMHESIYCGEKTLFPNAERSTKKLMQELQDTPGITLHGFTPPPITAQAVSQADFYIGITAAHTQMAETEMRTGVAEAQRTGCRILHKPTHGTHCYGLQKDTDYLAIDADNPETAAEIILMDYKRKQS